MVRSITRQVEPEWGAADRLLAEALFAYDSDLCPGCGLHRSILDDPDNNVLTFEDRFCEVCAGSERHARLLAARDHHWEQTTRSPEPHLPLAAHLKHAGVRRPADGRHSYLRRLAPDEIPNPPHKGGDPKKEA